MATTTVYCDESGTHHPNAPGPWLIGGCHLTHPSPHAYGKDALKELVRLLRGSDWFPALRERAKEKQNEVPKIAARCESLLKENYTTSHVHYTEISTAIKLTGKDPAGDESDWEGLRLFNREVMSVLERRVIVPVMSIHDGSSVLDASVNYSSQCLEFLSWLTTHLVHDVPDPERDAIQIILADKSGTLGTLNVGGFQQTLRQLSLAHLGGAIESGLASTGTISLLNRSCPLVDVRAMNMVALRLADLVCGVAANAVRGIDGFAAQKSVLEQLGFFVSMPLGDVQSRRAFVAEREGRLVEAVVLTMQSGGNHEALSRILYRLLSSSQPQSSRYAVDQIVEGVDRWSLQTDKNEIFVRCEEFVRCLDELSPRLRPSLGTEFDAIMFRVRSYALVWANHLGDLEAARRHTAVLAGFRERLAFDVQLLEPVSQHEIGVIELSINDHEFADAARLARDHVRRLATLSKESFDDLVSGSRYHGSNHTLRRAFTIYHRASLMENASLFGEIDGDEDMCEVACEAVEYSVERVRSVLSGSDGTSLSVSDRVRLVQLLGFGYELLAMFAPVRRGGCAELRELVEDSERCPEMARDRFGAAVLLRATGTLRLLKEPVALSPESSRTLRNTLLDCCADSSLIRHPEEIILREGLMAADALGFSPGELSAFRRRARERLAAWQGQCQHAARASTNRQEGEAGTESRSGPARVFTHQQELLEHLLAVQASGPPSGSTLLLPLTNAHSMVKRQGMSEAALQLVVHRARSIY